MRIYKPVSWLLSVNSYLWKSAYCYFDTSHLENFLKYIFEMGVNRKFDFWQVWKFCWYLSNAISGGNWLFRWYCFFFQVGLFTPLRTMRKNCGFVLIQYTKNQVIDQNTHVQSDCWFLWSSIPPEGFNGSVRFFK